MDASTRPKSAESHEGNRSKVCAPCGKKIAVKEIRPLSEKVRSLIVRFVNPDYDETNPLYPTGTCNTCRTYLLKADKTGETNKLPKMLNYEDIILQRLTRTNDPSTECNCCICLTARSHAKNKRISSDIIDENSGLIGSSDLSKLPPKMPESKKRSSLSICSKCKQETGPGLKHQCTVAQSSCNIVDQVLTMPEKQQEQVITSLLKTKIQNAACEGSDSFKDKTVILSTKGAKARVTLNPAPVKSGPQFSNESLDQLQMYLNNTSNKHMKGIAQWLRVYGGRSCVEPGFANHITEKGRVLSDQYNLSSHTFEGGDGKEVTLPVVWAKAEALLDAVAEARSIEGPAFVKVMADGGQGFLKICLTVLPENYNPDLDRASTEEEMEELSDGILNLSPLKKRSTYKEGGGIGNYKLTSVKRVIILAIVPDCKETYKNMKILFELTGLNGIRFLFVADFKLLLIVLGCQTATATCPCPYCLVQLREITSSVDAKGEDMSGDLYEERSFGMLQHDASRLESDYGSDRKKAKLCNSTVETPLFQEDPEVKVIDKCPLEELHCMMGFVNHTFFDGLVKVLGREKALQFPKSINLIAKDYHGSVFEGNACRAMLKNSDKMMEKEVLGNTSPLLVLPYVRCYKAMDKLVHACFGTKVVDKDAVVPVLQELVVSYMDLGLSVTLKMHVIFYHLLPALCNPALYGRGLGVVSGQAGESIHQEFKIFWSKYKINSLDNELYGENLMRAVVEFSSKHL